MNHTKQFIEDAIAGGWKHDGFNPIENLHQMLLDPFVWKAVFGTDLDEWVKDVDGDLYSMLVAEKWKIQMHRFIDHLCDGDSIETALSKLT